MNDIILEFRNISKVFPGVLALDGINLSFRRGEVHAIVGENGAGKSTLIKLLTGVYRPTDGEIFYDNEVYEEMTPIVSKGKGIGVIYQELSLVNELSVAENVFLGNAIRKGIIVDQKSMIKRSHDLFSQLGIDIDPTAFAGSLTVGYQQMVELAKTMIQDVKLLIMDEPTAPLSTHEVNKLFEVIEQLKSKGVTIVYISHRLEEIFKVSDRVSVLRDGQYITTKKTSETNREELVSLMVGRTLNEVFPERKKQGGKKETILEIKNFSGKGVKDISLKVYRNEILGFGGLVGSGRTELAQLIYGVQKLSSGELYLDSTPVKIKSPKKSMSNGIVLVPEDRKQQGLILKMSVMENISISIIKKLSHLFVVDRKKEKEIAKDYTKKLSIKTTNMERQVVNKLSGGNQQKVVLAKGLAVEPEIIIMDEPTRGIDVGAKQEIYSLMNELISQGKTIIMITSEMPELIGMSDRILVFCEGRITGELQREEFDQEKILKFASIAV